MKRYFKLIAATMILAACQEDISQQYSVTGYIEGTTDTMAYIKVYRNGEWTSIDSAMASEGNFQFTGTIESPYQCYLDLGDKGFYIFLENSKIDIHGNIDSLREVSISGSVAQDEYDQYLAAMEEINTRLDDLYSQKREARKAKDEAKTKKLNVLIEEAEDFEKQNIMQYILDHGNSIIAPHLTRRNSYLWELDELEKLVNSINRSFDNTIYMAELRDRIEILRKVAIGKPAVDFTMNDTSENPVALSSFKGKYLLVDFWASWCSPCREENPNVVACYNKFKDKNFEVLGVSLDQDRERWIQAIHDDHLTWTQVSDLVGWKNKAAGMYGVNSIPSNILIDPEGIIIARNLRGNDLRSKLDKIFSE